MLPKKQQPTQLSQTASLLQSFSGLSGRLANLMDLQQKIKHIGSALGNHHMSSEMKTEAKRMGADKVMSHAIAGRTLAQLGHGASKEKVAKDLQRTKESMQLAHAAFFDKDPKAISLLQLNDDADEDEEGAAGADTTDDEIYLFERANTE